ncbi:MULTISPECIES: ASCH domain-containing protein [unclassified Haloferax]|jgi:uncharacterized protein YhfF|uniref:ASCH domain-containing protein n=1 Tax=unclassified Haloferax TaxID=2625095 RepID=UPI0028743FD4|nr:MULTISPECIES: ASCH domain-containing protein [unclassified Haloferax]MDS0243131.1 ASCH domain-containing protein [Haloferax sp. S2CR25]MDS0446252.1 ASCH domain-containing protein [Haloferax sp. S2CR25-2]
MLFQEDHIEQIRSGEKTATRRDWSRKSAKEGGVYMATTSLFTSHDECDCYIRATSVEQQTLGDMTEEDAQKEGGYTLAEFRETWEAINGEGSWNPGAEVWIVEFEYVGEDQPDQ